MTAQEMIRKFGIEASQLADGTPAMRITYNIAAANKMRKEIVAAKTEILAEIARQGEEKVASRQAKAVSEWQASQWAVINHGSYLLEWELARVIALTPEEKSQFSPDFAVRNLYRTAQETETVDLTNARTLVSGIGRRGDGHLSYGESVLWLLTDEEAEAIIAGLAAENSRREAGETKKVSEAAKTREVKIAEAMATGFPVVLRRWMAECDGSVVECSTDAMTEMAYPDGKVKVVRTPTF